MINIDNKSILGGISSISIALGFYWLVLIILGFIGNWGDFVNTKKLFCILIVIIDLLSNCITFYLITSLEVNNNNNKLNIT